MLWQDLTVHSSAVKSIMKKEYISTVSHISQDGNEQCDINNLMSFLMNGHLKTSRLRLNVRHFADDIFNLIFWITIVAFPFKFQLNFVASGSINNIPKLVQITLVQINISSDNG